MVIWGERVVVNLNLYQFVLQVASKYWEDLVIICWVRWSSLVLGDVLLLAFCLSRDTQILVAQSACVPSRVSITLLGVSRAWLGWRPQWKQLVAVTVGDSCHWAGVTTLLLQQQFASVLIQTVPQAPQNDFLSADIKSELQNAMANLK